MCGSRGRRRKPAEAAVFDVLSPVQRLQIAAEHRVDDDRGVLVLRSAARRSNAGGTARSGSAGRLRPTKGKWGTMFGEGSHADAQEKIEALQQS